MAKFESKKLDQTVTFGGGIFVTFKDGVYETTNKDEIKLLKKCKNITEVGGRKATTPEV